MRKVTISDVIARNGFLLLNGPDPVAINLSQVRTIHRDVNFAGQPALDSMRVVFSPGHVCFFFGDGIDEILKELGL